jgi:hypothetical protein
LVKQNRFRQHPPLRRLSRKAIALTGWDQVATISGGHWSGEVRNVPTGGPYRFRIATDNT